jgi:hypothetical protein
MEINMIKQAFVWLNDKSVPTWQKAGAMVGAVIVIGGTLRIIALIFGVG